MQKPKANILSYDELNKYKKGKQIIIKNTINYIGIKKILLFLMNSLNLLKI